jgi:hypothetical protein
MASSRSCRRGMRLRERFTHGGRWFVEIQA